MPTQYDLPLRLHRIISRLSRDGGDAEEVATLAEAAAHIVLLERQVAATPLPAVVSELDALRAAKLLLDQDGAAEAWRLLIARGARECLAGSARDQAITEQVLDALRKLVAAPGAGERRH